MHNQRPRRNLTQLVCAFLLATIASLDAVAAFDTAMLDEIDRQVASAIAEKKCPGGVLWFEHRGEVYKKAYGNRAVVPAPEAMTEDTIFDAASLTKVLACTPAVMLLVERGQIDLDAPVRTYLPEFPDTGESPVKIRHLLTHTSGLRPGISTKGDWQGHKGVLQQISHETLQSKPGEVFRYSDINFITLGEVVSRVAGKPLEEFVWKELYKPLGMVDSGYLPPVEKLGRIAPTEVVEGKPFRGVVHDPTSRKMGGVAGHAGFFTTAADMAKFARMMLNEGELDGKRIFKPETVKMMTSVQTAESVGARRGLGWDIDSSYSGPRGRVFPLGSYGHTGWTGTSLWIDPFSRSFVIFLSNRNHPTEDGSVLALRSKIGTFAATAIDDFNFQDVRGALPPRTVRSGRDATKSVLNGIDVLVRQKFAPLRGLRIALITNHTGQDRERHSTIDLLHDAPGVELKLLFSPEHGIRGTMDEKISDSIDEKTGLKVVSLYGENRKPKPEQLAEIDAIVYDIQDIGCRFYTYPSTLGLAVEAAAENNKKIFVLDRVNPLNGTSVEGPVLDAKPTFVGFYEVPLRHGMTVGELARMYNAEKRLKADLQVIACENWRREDGYDRTGLPWTNPSPNMRTFKQAILYPGVGLLESALSVGRGTDTPFEVLGAPYIDDIKLSAELNALGLEGISFVPVQFTPSSSVYKAQLCKGVYLMLNNPDRCQVVVAGLEITRALCRMYPKDFNPDKIKHLLLHPSTLEMIKNGRPMSEIIQIWQPKLADFSKVRTRYLIYP